MTEEQIAWLAAQLVEAEHRNDMAIDANIWSDVDYTDGLRTAYGIVLAKLAPQAAEATNDAIKEYRDNEWENYVSLEEEGTKDD